jgi:hypothetical protein
MRADTLTRSDSGIGEEKRLREKERKREREKERERERKATRCVYYSPAGPNLKFSKLNPN